MCRSLYSSRPSAAASPCCSHSWCSCRFAGVKPRPRYVLAATAAALWLEPVFQALLFGQVNLALACLVLWDFQSLQGMLARRPQPSPSSSPPAASGSYRTQAIWTFNYRSDSSRWPPLTRW
nr:glycosyltransferase 87 family protein [Streptomyces sp. WM6378]